LEGMEGLEAFLLESAKNGLNSHDFFCTK